MAAAPSAPSGGTQRTLIVLRHAKAEQSAPSDNERPLAPRGPEDAAAAGDWLASIGVSPDAALVSSAKRTRETWAAVARAADWDVAPTIDDGLYAAGVDTALDVLRGLEDAVSCAISVGHNPTAAYLVSLPDDGDGDDEASNALAAGYPTNAAAVLAFHGDWADLDPGMATLRAFHVARA